MSEDEGEEAEVETSAAGEAPLVTRDKLRESASEVLLKYSKQITRAVLREVEKIPKTEIEQGLWEQRDVEDLVCSTIVDARAWGQD